MKATKKITVTAEWIQRYAKSIDAPLQYLHGRLIAPATMPIVFWQQFNHAHFHDTVPVLHGSQQFIYHLPIQEGMVLDCELALSQTEHKQGKQGPMTFNTYTLNCFEQGTEIVQVKTVLIHVGAAI
ncbi:FAS1-like dehydratase domain-containing protein [Lysinibacillus sp. JNUCC-52]|uniref:FAS1-like dehydratase domain-containing protein n=1 Tax=Lysinibacillus sp. JNUCC-52 TaxID=2792480 RepID=UPI001936FFBE|nr:MaoC family dehydratase N-terminal domain-containing protein [Lysinibacillus sp. JNUCC-52]